MSLVLVEKKCLESEESLAVEVEERVRWVSFCMGRGKVMMKGCRREMWNIMGFSKKLFVPEGR